MRYLKVKMDALFCTVFGGSFQHCRSTEEKRTETASGMAQSSISLVHSQSGDGQIVLFI